MEGQWLPPQAPGSSPPPPIPPGAPPPAPPFEATDDAPHPPAPPPPPDDRPNNDAVVAISCALSGAALLFWTNGISTLASLTLGIIGVVYAKRARLNVEQGRTTKHADLASGANVAAWITVGLSIIATIGWILVIVLS